VTATPESARDDEEDETPADAPRARSRWFRARHEVLWLFLLALAIRAVVAVVNPAIVDDSVTLLRLAAKVGSDGIGAVITSSEHPLLPCLIAWLPGAPDSETTAIALSVFAGAFAVWPLHTIARRACGRHAATAASIVYAALPKAVGIATVPHTSAVLLPLLLSGLALAMVAPIGDSKRTRLIRLVGSGLMCGLAYLCRPEGAVAAFGAVVAALAMAKRGRRLSSAAIVAGVFVLLAAPYAIALSHHKGHFELSPKKSLDKLLGVEQAPGDDDRAAGDDEPAPDGGAAGDAASAFEGALTAPVFVLVLAGIAVPRRWRRGPARRARFVVLHMAAVFVALLMRVRWGWGYSNARHMLTSGVLLLPFAGEGMHFMGGFISRAVARRRLTIVLASFFAIPCAVRCVTRPEGATRADARALGELIGRQTPGGEPVIVASFRESVVAYYAERVRDAPVADLPLWRSFGGSGAGKRLPSVLSDATERSGALGDILRRDGAKWIVLDLFSGSEDGGATSPGRTLAAKLVADGTVSAPATAAGSSLAAFPVR
jgi:hypothetical protein